MTITRWVRTRPTGDPRRHLAAHIAALGNGHTPVLRRSNGPDAGCEIYDRLCAEFFGPVDVERVA